MEKTACQAKPVATCIGRRVVAAVETRRNAKARCPVVLIDAATRFWAVQESRLEADPILWITSGQAGDRDTGTRHESDPPYAASRCAGPLLRDTHAWHAGEGDPFDCATAAFMHCGPDWRARSGRHPCRLHAQPGAALADGIAALVQSGVSCDLLQRARNRESPGHHVVSPLAGAPFGLQAIRASFQFCSLINSGLTGIRSHRHIGFAHRLSCCSAAARRSTPGWPDRRCSCNARKSGASGRFGGARIRRGPAPHAAGHQIEGVEPALQGAVEQGDAA